MIIIGVHVGSDDDAAAIAVVRKRFQNLRHYYEVIDLISCTGESVPHRLPDILRHPLLPKRKRIFSQDRRPPKMVKDRPWLLLHTATYRHDFVAALQHPDVSFKRVRIGAGLNHSTERGDGGPDYIVDMTELVQRLAAVVSEQRLDVVDDCPRSVILRRDLNTLGIMAAEPLDGPLLALALPVWFREVIPYRRAYRSV